VASRKVSCGLCAAHIAIATPLPSPLAPATPATSKLPKALWDAAMAAGAAGRKPSVTADVYAVAKRAHDSLPPGVKSRIPLAHMARMIGAVRTLRQCANREWPTGGGGGLAIGTRLPAPARAALSAFVLGGLHFAIPVRPTDGTAPAPTRAIAEGYPAHVLTSVPPYTVAVDEAHYKKDASAPGRVGEGVGGMGREGGGATCWWVSCVRS
jgi:hypothetical protein